MNKINVELTPADASYLRHYFEIPEHIPDEQIQVYIHSLRKKKGYVPLYTKIQGGRSCYLTKQ